MEELFGCCRFGWRSSVAEHSLGKGEVESSILSASSISFPAGGSNSVVESQPSKLLVAGSIPVSRSKLKDFDLGGGIPRQES